MISRPGALGTDLTSSTLPQWRTRRCWDKNMNLIDSRLLNLNWDLKSGAALEIRGLHQSGKKLFWDLRKKSSYKHFSVRRRRDYSSKKRKTECGNWKKTLCWLSFELQWAFSCLDLSFFRVISQFKLEPCPGFTKPIWLFGLKDLL